MNPIAVVREIDLYGRAVAYRQAGSGPVVVLLHGLGATMDEWLPVAGPMAEWCTVVAVDLPGHGRSAAPAGDYSLGAYASAVRDLLDALGHRSATIVGHSLGGGIAMQFAYQFPERVERLVLVASGGLGPEISRWLRAATLPGSHLVLRLLESRVMDRVLRRRGGASNRAARALRRRTFVRALRAVVDHRGQQAAATNRLHLLDRVPTLVVWGADDRIIPVSHAVRAHRAMPGSRLQVLAGAGHCPHIEQPTWFEACLRELVLSAGHGADRPDQAALT